MYDVFISYSRKDSEIMQKLRVSLDDSGLVVWTDQQLRSGDFESWKFLIQRTIENSGCLVAIFTPDAKDSKWVNKELSYAETHGKPIFRVLARGDERTSIPFGYTDMQFIDIRRYDEAKIVELISSIYERLGKSAPPKKQYSEKGHIENIDLSKGDWRRTGAIFWISYDLQWTYVELMQGGSADQINRGFRQCHHHAKRIGFMDGTVERLAKVMEVAAKFPNDEDWTPQQRGQFGYEIRDYF